MVLGVFDLASVRLVKTVNMIVLVDKIIFLSWARSKFLEVRSKNYEVGNLG